MEPRLIARWLLASRFRTVEDTNRSRIEISGSTALANACVPSAPPNPGPYDFGLECCRSGLVLSDQERHCGPQEIDAG